VQTAKPRNSAGRVIMATVAVKAVKAVRLPKKVAEGSLAGKIRFLNEKGLTRVQIAAQLGIRYQRVRNVLVPRVKAQVTEIEESAIEAGTEIEPGTEDLLEAS
jgi:hypothetical protein